MSVGGGRRIGEFARRAGVTPELLLFVSGRQRVPIDDGTEMEFGPGDVAIIDPGHDGWVLGDEPNVLFERAEATSEE